MERAADYSGRVLAGYRLGRRLGQGARSAVYDAVGPDGRVVLKVFDVEPTDDASKWEWMRRDAEAVLAVGHRNIARVLDVQHLSGNPPVAAQEHLSGQTLEAHLVHPEMRLRVHRAVRIARQVLLALHAGHGVDVIHRSISPSNVFLVAVPGDMDFAKVLDYGLVRALTGEEQITAAKAGRPAPAPDYWAPEQVVDATVEARTDVFAVGVLLYRLLTGRLPFDGPDFEAKARARLDKAPTPVKKLRAGVATPLAGAVERALARDPARRWPSARAMADALTDFEAEILDDDDEEDTTIEPVVNLDEAPVRMVAAPKSRKPTLLGIPMPTDLTGPLHTPGGSKIGPAVPAPPLPPFDHQRTRPVAEHVRVTEKPDEDASEDTTTDRDLPKPSLGPFDAVTTDNVTAGKAEPPKPAWRLPLSSPLIAETVREAPLFEREAAADREGPTKPALLRPAEAPADETRREVDKPEEEPDELTVRASPASEESPTRVVVSGEYEEPEETTRRAGGAALVLPETPATEGTEEGLGGRPGPPRTRPSGPRARAISKPPIDAPPAPPGLGLWPPAQGPSAPQASASPVAPRPAGALKASQWPPAPPRPAASPGWSPELPHSPSASDPRFESSPALGQSLPFDSSPALGQGPPFRPHPSSAMETDRYAAGERAPSHWKPWLIGIPLIAMLAVGTVFLTRYLLETYATGGPATATPGTPGGENVPAAADAAAAALQSDGGSTRARDAGSDAGPADGGSRLDAGPSRDAGAPGGVDLPEVPGHIAKMPRQRRRTIALQVRNRAHRMFRGRRYETAEASYRRSLVYEPESGASAIGLARTYLRTGRMDAAIAWARRATEVEPREPGHFSLLGTLLLRTGDRDGARTAWERAVRISPRNRRLRRQLATLDQPARR